MKTKRDDPFDRNTKRRKANSCSVIPSLASNSKQPDTLSSALRVRTSGQQSCDNQPVTISLAFVYKGCSVIISCCQSGARSSEMRDILIFSNGTDRYLVGCITSKHNFNYGKNLIERWRFWVWVGGEEWASKGTECVARGQRTHPRPNLLLSRTP